MKISLRRLKAPRLLVESAAIFFSVLLAFFVELVHEAIDMPESR